MDPAGQPRVERRLAAILAADVAGYSRLMEADEEGTLAALRGIRRGLGDPKIAEHRGRIVKTTGDGMLVEFASVVDAVRCAMEVQRAMADRNTDIPPAERIEFRIGIHQGDVIIEDGDIFGVLPFQNMTGDARQEYFVDGMVEEITTAFSRLPWLFVIARNSSFTYKGKAVDVKQVARELGVRYVLEGSVRKSGNRVRITGQLIDAATGNHIWADRFDGALEDIFDLQDRVASSVVGAIEPKLRLSEIERASRKPTGSLGAYDLYLRALAQVYRHTEEGFGEAVTLLRQALAIDPFYAPAAALVGFCRTAQRVTGWGGASESDIAEDVRLARQALEHTRDDPDTMTWAANTLFYVAGEVALAAAVLDRALTLNPNSATAWTCRGIIYALRNQPAAAIEALESAQRLSPFDPLGYVNAWGFALANIAAGRFEQAIEWADRALRDRPRFIVAIRAKIVANAHLGRLDEARKDLARMLALYPGLTIAGYRAFIAPSTVPEVIDLMIAGLRLAGLPEE
jgi:TolB-like protein